MYICLTGMHANTRSLMPHDRTRTALQRQLRGLGLDTLEVSIIRGDEHRSVNLWTSDEILARLPNLKRANLAGAHLYVRGPRDRDHDLVFLDDLDRFTPDKMKAAGHDPAVVVETSPGNAQAWVRLGTPCPPSIRHEVSRRLAQLYGGDPGAIDPHQSGRLAGFTNRKPEHRTARGFPFVLLLNAPGHAAPAAADLIRAAERDVAEKQAAADVKPAVDIAAGSAFHDLAETWSREYRERGGDLSAIDWSITHRALAAGYDPADIAATLEAVADRRGKHAGSYAERTVRAALAARVTSTPSP